MREEERKGQRWEGKGREGTEGKRKEERKVRK